MWSREAPPLGQEPPGGPTWGLLGAPATPEELQRVRNHSRAQPEPEPRRSALVPAGRFLVQHLLQPPAVWNWTRRFWSCSGPSGPQPRPAPGRAEALETPAGVSSQTDRQNKVLPVVGQIKAALFWKATHRVQLPVVRQC